MHTYKSESDVNHTLYYFSYLTLILLLQMRFAIQLIDFVQANRSSFKSFLYSDLP